MKTNWIFEGNTFESNTRNSNKKALTLFEDVYAKLRSGAQTDSELMEIYSHFEPHYLAYQQIYAQKQSVAGIYEGHTMQFEKFIADMPTQVRKWESVVRYHFVEDSPEERMIFPNKRSPFLSGTYEERVNAVKSFGMTIGNFPPLASLRMDVEAYYAELEGTRLRQQEREGENDKLSNLLEAQRLVTCDELYGVLARLMFKYRHNRDRISMFFDLSLIRSAQTTGSSTIFSGTVLGLDNTPISNAMVVLPEVGFEATTDEFGYFELETETGTFLVQVSKAGYTTYSAPNVVFVKNEPKKMTFQLAKE